jgi:uracil-DNA glycosylase family 4
MPGSTPGKPLQILHDKMISCRKCSQAGYRVHPGAIFSGVASARVMIIGQAPGITEVEAGRPFNAGSGTRLFQWLGEAGVDEATFRKRQYMTSVTKCYPGKASNGNGDRVPSKEEQALCRPFLKAEIELVDPALILPVGRLAINLFFPAKLPLKEIIGRELLVDDRWVVPLPHPSGASRWHQIETNQALIRQAMLCIQGHLERLALI